MNALPFALSLSSSVTDIGAIAAFAALLGIAILSLLVFSQAREIKRLREWAGRAPERATELEQRVSADAAARAQRPGAPPAPGRVVPRKTPLVSAPVSTAVNATVAAAIPGVGAAPATVPPVPPASPPGGEPGSPAATGEAVSQADNGVQAAPAAVEAAAAKVEQSSPTGERQIAASVGGSDTAAEEPAADKPAQPDGERKDSAEGIAASVPATAAARAAGVSARAPLPPPPSAPAPPGGSALPAIAGDSIPAAQSPKPVSRPPGPVAARRSVPSRASSVRTTDQSADSGGPKYFKPERSNGRAMVLIVGGVIVVVLLLVFAVSALKGGGSKAAPIATQSPSSGSVQTSTPNSHTTAQVTASNPAEIAVVVLNGTSTAGLAHHLAADLQQSGYSHAEASAGVPPGTHATTAVEYTHGHRADAQAVAKTLDVTQVQAIEGTIASLAGSATVVVLAGADQATELGGGGAQSKGEPAATATGATGEGTAGSGN
jgi:hypothetical protein